MQSSLVRVSQLSEEPAASVIINSNNDDDDDGVGHLIINTVHVADNMGITSQKMVIFVQYLIVRFDVLIDSVAAGSTVVGHDSVLFGEQFKTFQ
jgi:hypothetical protein